MKKSKLIKLLVSALSLCLLIGAMVGITAFATDGGGETNPTVEVVSENVSYGDQLYLYYAVYAENVGENFVKLKVYDANGELRYIADPATKPLGTVGAAAGQYTEDGMIWLKNGSGELKLCYVFVTSGVAAKEINTVEIVKPVIVDAEGNEVVSGEDKSYSVEDYLLEKLYKEGYALEGYKNDGDGLAIQRRTLYCSMMKYGSTAQAVLAPEAVNVIGGVGYAYIKDTEVTIGKNYAGYDVMYLEYTDYENIPAGKAFLCWNVYVYDAFGNLIETKYASLGAPVSIEDDKFYFAVPELVDTDSFANLTIPEDTVTTGVWSPSFNTPGGSISAALTHQEFNENLKEGAVPFSSLTSDENGMTITQSRAHDSTNSSFNYTSSASYSNVNYVVFEANVNFNVIKGSQFYFQTSGGSNLVYCYVADKGGNKLIARPQVATAEGNQYIHDFTITADEFIKFRFEYFEGTNKNDSVMKMFVNGEMVYSASGGDFKAFRTAEDVSRFSIGFQNGCYGNIIVKDAVFAKSNVDCYSDYTYWNKGVSSNDNYVAQNGYISFQYGIPAWITLTTTANAKYELAMDANGERVLHNTKLEKTLAGSSLYNLTKADEANANKIILEYDIKAELAGQVSYYFNNRFIGLNSEGNSLGAWFSGNFSLGELSSKASPIDKWIHVKIEYTAKETEEEYYIAADGTKGKLVAANYVITVTDMKGNEFVSENCDVNYLGRTKTEGEVCYYYEKQLLVSEITNAKLSHNSGTLIDAYYKNVALYKVYDASLDAAK